MTEEGGGDQRGGGDDGGGLFVCRDGPVTSSGFLISCGTSGGEGGAVTSTAQRSGIICFDEHPASDRQRKEEQN